MKAGQKAESRFKGCMITAVAAVAIAAILAICCIFTNDDSQVAAESGNLDENISWTFDPNTGALTIQGTGEMPNDPGREYPWKAFDVRTVTVSSGITKIAKYAFTGCGGITSIELSDTVGTIGEQAFANCTSLVSISMSENVTVIGTGAFERCTSLTSFHIPAHCIYFGPSALRGCSSLVIVTSDVNCELKGIQGNTFCECYNLVNVTLPAQLTTIDREAFRSCNNLIIRIPDTVTHIEPDTFYDCFIAKMTLGTGLTAFRGPFTHTEIFEIVNLTGKSRMSSLDWNESQYGPAAKHIITYEPISKVSIDGNYIVSEYDDDTRLLRYIGKEAEPTLPDKIAGRDYIIHGGAFKYNDSITDITIPGTVTGIEDYAFEYCNHLRTIRISEGLKTLGYFVTRCPLLLYAEIPESVTSIAEYPFANCPLLFEVVNLSGIQFESGASVVTTMGDRTFTTLDGGFTVGSRDGANYLLRYVGNDADPVLPDSVYGGDYRIYNNAFSGNGSIRMITIPDSVLAIGDEAFRGTSVTEVTIGDSVETIGIRTFRDCSELASVTFGDSVDWILPWAFECCLSLTSLSFNDSLTTIDEDAFYKCTGLVSVAFGDSIETIGDGAFCYDFCNSSGDPFDTAVSLRGKTFTLENDIYLHLPAVKMDTAGGNVIAPLIGHAGDAVSAPSDPVRGGYVFMGWTYNSQPYTFDVIPDDDITIRAEWDAIEYTVTFYSEGVLFFSEDLDYDQPVILPPQTPVKESTADKVFNFSEWAGYRQGMTVNGNMQFDAVYVPSDREYAVTFLSEGTQYERMMMHYQDTIVLPFTDPTKPSDSTYDYSFGSWNGYTAGMKVGGDVTFDAVFDRSFHEYTVRFTSNGSTFSESNMHYGDTIAAPDTVPTKESTPTYEYTFYGWEGYSQNMTVTKDIDFDAMFTESFRDYTVNFLFNDGVYSSLKLHYQATITIPMVNPSIPSDDTYDHVFRGWEGYTDGMKVTNSISFNAVFEDVYREYTIVFSVDNAVVSMESKHFGDAITAPSTTPAKDSDERFDYTFSGWGGYSEGMKVSGNMAFPAVFHQYVKIQKSSEGTYSADSAGNYASFTEERMGTIVEDAKSDPSVTLKVSVGGATIKFDNASLRSLSSGAAELSLNQVSADKMDEATKNIVGNNPVYDIDFGDNKDFGDGVVTVGLPYVLESGKDPSRLSVFHIANGKVAEEMECQYENGSVIFSTGHFSTYAIMYEEPESSGSGFPIMYVVIGSVAVLAVAGAVFFIVKKH